MPISIVAVATNKYFTAFTTCFGYQIFEKYVLGSKYVKIKWDWEYHLFLDYDDKT